MILSVHEGILCFSELSYIFVPLSNLYVGLKLIVGSENPLKALPELISLVN